jgi:hypothetical protein
MRAIMLATLLIAWPARAEDTRGGAILGVVTDAAGVPVSAATVILRGSTPAPITMATRSNAEGRFALRGLFGGEYELLTIYGEAKRITRDIRLEDRQIVEVRTVLETAPEVIEIPEPAPPPTLPRVVKKTAPRILPYSDDAILTDHWGVAWLLLEIDAAGLVSSFRFLHRPGRGLDEIAEAQAWKLRFEPARDAAGRAVPSQLLWKMEWPSYWYARTVQGAPLAAFQSRARTILGVADRTVAPFLLPLKTSQRVGPPCRGRGPLNLGSAAAVYRDCSQPDFDKAFTEVSIVRKR